jgi:methyl-accepting chemotaxis protein
MATKLKRRSVRLATKIVIYISFFALLLGTSMFFALRYWIIPTVETEMRNGVLSYAKVAANLVDGDVLKRILPEKLATTSAEYIQINNIEKKIMATDVQIDDVYAMAATADPNTVRFVVDGYETKDRNGNGVIEPDERTAGVGEAYDVTNVPVLKNGFLFPSLSQSFYTDKWGTFLTSAAPVIDENGLVVGIVGVDIRMEKILAEERLLYVKLGAYLAAFLLILLLMATVLSRLIVNSVGNLNKAVLRITDEESTDLLPDTGGDEISELSKSINKLINGLREARSKSDEKVQEKTKNLEEKLNELERLNKLMVGREVTMFELKKKLKEENGKL